MQKKLVIVLAILTLSLVFLAGCPPKETEPKQQGEENTPKVQEEATPKDTVIALKTDKAPEIDGVADEAWKDAKALTIPLFGAATLQGGTGGNYKDGKTEIKVKALYDDNNLYMQLQWADPTQSIARGPWIKEKGKLVLKPYDEFYEDKVAVLWNMNDSVKGFDQKGCMATCHTTEFKTDKGTSIKKHFTNGENEMLDMWHWKLTRQNTLFGPDKPGLMHDQFMDNAQYDPNDEETKSAGRHADPGEKEYKVNANEEKTQPLKVFDGKALNGNPYVIVEGIDKTKDFDSAMVEQMKDGDFIPGAIAFQISGDPADIPAKGKYENGMWTLELKRPLKTQSDKDIQFEDLKQAYLFGLAGFDNSQIGHAYHIGAKTLIFQDQK